MLLQSYCVKIIKQFGQASVCTYIWKFILKIVHRVFEVHKIHELFQNTPLVAYFEILKDISLYCVPFQKQNLSGFSNSPLKCICSQQLILNSRLCCCQASNQQGICSPIFQHFLQIKTRLKSLLDYNEWKIFRNMVDNFTFAWRLPDNCLMTQYLYQK